MNGGRGFPPRLFEYRRVVAESGGVATPASVEVTRRLRDVFLVVDFYAALVEADERAGGGHQEDVCP